MQNPFVFHRMTHLAAIHLVQYFASYWGTGPNHILKLLCFSWCLNIYSKQMFSPVNWGEGYSRLIPFHTCTEDVAIALCNECHRSCLFLSCIGKSSPILLKDPSTSSCLFSSHESCYSVSSLLLQVNSSALCRAGAGFLMHFELLTNVLCSAVVTFGTLSGNSCEEKKNPFTPWGPRVFACVLPIRNNLRPCWRLTWGSTALLSGSSIRTWPVAQVAAKLRGSDDFWLPLPLWLCSYGKSWFPLLPPITHQCPGLLPLSPTLVTSLLSGHPILSASTAMFQWPSPAIATWSSVEIGWSYIADGGWISRV